MRQEDRDLENEVAHEIDAQISLLKASGIPLRHLDGHQHVHVFPAVLKAMLGAALKTSHPMDQNSLRTRADVPGFHFDLVPL